MTHASISTNGSGTRAAAPDRSGWADRHRVRLHHEQPGSAAADRAVRVRPVDHVSVSPDVLPQDGASQSLITVDGQGINGEPLRNVTLRDEITSTACPWTSGRCRRATW